MNPVFNGRERKILSGLGVPRKIQDYLDRLGYNLEESGETCFSPRKVLREKKLTVLKERFLPPLP